jgi:RNA polymerase sigma-70 factor (ECF subfamily)
LVNPGDVRDRPKILKFAARITRLPGGMSSREQLMAMEDLVSAKADAAGVDGGVFERFTRRLIGLARSQLDARFHHKIELEDVVQSVYKSFLIRYGDGALATEGEQGLWGLLTCITVRKCADRVRYHRAARRDLGREAPAVADGVEPWRAAAGREPTPDEAAVLAETVEHLLRGLRGDERSVVELSLQGFTAQEISGTLGRAERSVRRLRERVRKQLEELRSQGS